MSSRPIQQPFGPTEPNTKPTRLAEMGSYSGLSGHAGSEPCGAGFRGEWDHGDLVGRSLDP